MIRVKRVRRGGKYFRHKKYLICKQKYDTFDAHAKKALQNLFNFIICVVEFRFLASQAV